MKKKKWARAYELRAMFRADCVIDDRGSDFYYILYSIFVKEKQQQEKKSLDAVVWRRRGKPQSIGRFVISDIIWTKEVEQRQAHCCF